MQAGSLDRRITLQRLVEDRDETGGRSPRWEIIATVWASYRPLSAKEQIVGAERTAKADVEFKIRWSTQVRTLAPKDQVVWGDRCFDIFQVFEEGRQEGIVIKATERDHILVKGSQ